MNTIIISIIVIIIIGIIILFHLKTDSDSKINPNIYQKWDAERQFKPKWNPLVWNKKQNCYSYAFNDIDEPAWSYQQPGNFSDGRIPDNKFTCENVLPKVVSDNQHTKIIECSEECDDFHHKIALVVDKDKDYHFYREDSNKQWSHKLGDAIPLRLPINEYPWTINRDYTTYNYKDFCGCMCVKSDGIIGN